VDYLHFSPDEDPVGEFHEWLIERGMNNYDATMTMMLLMDLIEAATIDPYYLRPNMLRIRRKMPQNLLDLPHRRAAELWCEFTDDALQRTETKRKLKEISDKTVRALGKGAKLTKRGFVTFARIVACGCNLLLLDYL